MEALDIPAVKTKLKLLLKSNYFSNEIDSKFCVENSLTLTHQLVTLKQSLAVKIESEGVLFACELDQLFVDFFLGLYANLKTLYVREDVIPKFFTGLWEPF